MEKIITSIDEQYSINNTDIDFKKFYELKIRNQHAFQLQFTLDVIDNYIEKKQLKNGISLMDVGDSSGNHLLQLKALSSNIKSISSVNIDKNAIDKIKKKNIPAYHCKAEELTDYNVKVDLLISFQMLEHLTDPIKFLHAISKKDICDRFIFSVPYVKNSRVGLQHIKHNIDDTVHTSETVHIYELSPEDWKLISQFSGWEIISEKKYLQYPSGLYGIFLKYLWRKFDFEGFYIFELKKNNKWSELYADW